jgi:hypothetical protein
MARKDLLTRLTDAGEEAMHRLQDAPGGNRLTGVANSMRDRVDEMQKKVRGIDALEKRIVELEKRVDALSKATPNRAPAKRAPTSTRARKPKPKTPPATEESTAPAGGESPG